MSELTHRSLACKAHLNMSIENALYKFITITQNEILVYKCMMQKMIINYNKINNTYYLLCSFSKGTYRLGVFSGMD